ncbi:MAG: AtpZ/AtpI family protein [Deltaproteobacteria bacterium]|nr:AtpZ/AtpI family protein [Deltaproteobacteria bacterium]
MKEETKKFIKELLEGGWRASAIGLSLVLAIAIGAGLGWWLSEVFNNKIFFYIGLILGIIAGFRNLYIMGKRYK